MSDNISNGGVARIDTNNHTIGSTEKEQSVHLEQRPDELQLGECPECSDNRPYSDTKTEIGICENCHSLGKVGVSCIQCEDSGLVYVRLVDEEQLDKMDKSNNDNGEDALSRRLKLIDEEGVGICCKCKEVGPFGTGCQNRCLGDNHEVVVYDVFYFVMRRDEGICPFCKHVGISGDMCEACGRWWYTRPKESLNGEYMAT